jgi:hypothetical protein
MDERGDHLVQQALHNLRRAAQQKQDQATRNRR